jgi:hypothetical protein
MSVEATVTDDERTTTPCRCLDEGIAHLTEARAVFARLYADSPGQMVYLQAIVQITNLLQPLQGGPPA